MVSMITILPAMYNIGLCKLGTDGDVNFMDKVQCCIPVYGWFYARNLYSNHYLSFGGVANLIAIIGFLLRISTMFIKSLPQEQQLKIENEIIEELKNPMLRDIKKNAESVFYLMISQKIKEKMGVLWKK